LKSKTAKKTDHYKTLGVKKSDNEATIRKAYKKLALKWHPDKHNGNDEDKAKAGKMFREINEAMNVLGDPAKREAHDKELDVESDPLKRHKQ
jgi:DnaJ-class molecular chaperone